MIEPPSGHPPPLRAQLHDGEALDLLALAQEICSRYRAEFPDEQERYGDAGIAWCVHDNQHLLNWAVAEQNGYGGFERQVSWLANVLEARDFPIDRLARDLEIAATVIEERLEAGAGALSATLLDGARLVRSRSLDPPSGPAVAGA
ncbi:MAG TPA: hypothetical protein VEY90_09995 [Thermoleophilaceae bacterium]|nr:hypothetical protein [Thermoleophilaceae bacterium]